MGFATMWCNFMKHKHIITVCLAALAASSHAAIIHMADYESETAIGLNNRPQGMEFSGGGGDHVGQAGFGISDQNPRSGSYSYVVDNQTANNGTGWGGATWSGTSTVAGMVSSGVVSQADAQANSTPASPLGYINVVEGAVFSVSAWVATDGDNPVTGTPTAHVRLEFHDANGNEVFRDLGNAVNGTDLTGTYQEITHEYTLTAADIANGVTRVTGLIGTDGHSFNNGAGQIFVDDFSFEVNDANFIVIPEPSSFALGLLGIFGFAARRRR